MIRVRLLSLLLGLGSSAAAQQQPAVALRPGLVITRSTRIAPRRYQLRAPASLDSALLVVRGSHLTLDLRGVALLGQPAGTDPDAGQGVAIRIEGGQDVRVLGGRIRGFKVALLARGTRGLTVRGLDASYNWKPRLYSVIEHESLADWLSFHHNEQSEWLRYGAALYLDGVRGGELRDNRASQGMNGLLLVRSDSLRVIANDFSFNSGLGIGLYRASGNRILDNRLDFDVRGYSHGFYRRGQDSAGLLLYEQSSGNLVAFNSATHGGDGLFLWAGQSTMDSGQGGANDNVFFANDFSFAPANAMEATFSRNAFLANRAGGSDYGLWGGYSYESEIAGNCFAGNRVGVAIEHGQDNRITGNLFAGDSTALFFWADPVEPSDWGYPRRRDTRSRDYRIAANRFAGNRVALRARNTAGLQLAGNRYAEVDTLAVLRDTSGFRADSAERLSGGAAASSMPVFPAPGAASVGSDPCAGTPGLPAGVAPRVARPARLPDNPLARSDRSAIVVDEWGPYDWRSPRLWPADSSRAVPLALRTLGPPGYWRVVDRRGLAGVSRLDGRIGDTVVVIPADPGDWELGLEYRGAATVSPTGVARPAGVPVRFAYGRFEPETDWTARFFAWPAGAAGADTLGFAREVAGTPRFSRQLSRLDFEWYRPPLGELPREHWGMEASAEVVLPPGAYRLRTISDDGIRVWLDGVLVIDRWAPHESLPDEVALGGGRHGLLVRYYQADGWTELRVELLRAAPPRTG